MPESALDDNPALVHLIMLGAILCSGIFVTAQMPRNDIGELIYGTIDSAVINIDNLSPALDSLRSLPGTIQVLAVLLMVKGISFLKAAPILLFGCLLGTIDARIKLCEPGRESVHLNHSVTGYHFAKKAFVFSLLYMPFLYIAFPLELILQAEINVVKYCFIGINSAICYYAFYKLNINKPPRT